jgi:hypothetical protein
VTHTSKTHRPRWVRALTTMTSLFAVAALAVPSAAHGGTQTAPAPAGGTVCGKAERRAALAAEQRRVLQTLKGFRVLKNQQDMDRIAAASPTTGTAYNVMPHAYASMKGNGFTLVNTGTGNGPGKPQLIFYRPARGAGDVLDANGADFPYVLVGWGYVGPYSPGAPLDFGDDAGLRCLETDDWFVHERSVHPADTWHNIPVRPQEDYLGQVPGSEPPTAEECKCPVGMNHGRFWDAHLWLDGDSVPTVSMLNPGRPIPGFDPVVGSGFFYPEAAPPGSAPQPAPEPDQGGGGFTGMHMGSDHAHHM